MDDLAAKWKAWKKYKATLYKRYRNPGKKSEMKRKSGKRLNKKGPLKTSISELISPEIRMKLNKIC